MEVTRSTGAAAVTAAQTPASLAKGALRRLALSKLEPTPANFARCYAEEAGEAPPAEGTMPARAKPLIERLVARASDDVAMRGELTTALLEGRYDDLQRLLDRGAEGTAAQAQAWATLIDKLARALERGSRQWTPGRKKESLQRVLDSSRSDALRLQQRLRQLIAAWEGDGADTGVEVNDDPAEAVAETPQATAVAAATPRSAAAPDHQPRIVEALEGAVRAGLPTDQPRAVELADELALLARRIQAEGATVVVAEAVVEVCQRARRLFAHRHHLVDELMALCRSLTDGLTELAEDESWARGQSQALRERLDDTAGTRAVRAARELLADTRERQRSVRSERAKARDALKAMITHMLSELGELDQVTGRFSEKVTGYADVIEKADSIESLAEVVRGLVGDTRAVHDVVASARQRMADEHARASELEGQVRQLEGELRKLSEEVSTDMLTQIANRRGLMQSFEAERARIDRGGPVFAVGLIDIDNFKKLNDTLGHAAGDVALKSLAARVKEWLRPVDHVARFGGEEFVVLLTATPVDEAQQVLTRLQRQLTASLFMHDGREVFVTFSAGVTAYRPGEALELALERADEALYEAKRTGKNRTCIS
ncbi:GGDEF domain-containing protein [Aquabacterium sp.]|uniref:GGDEF domain-containing protein n=1 Tax=Aquabacterium sp. TaxID=1872578 RepID=UPI002B893CAB|nr:GGDEF domain-containing protein [Aquabacterium sp.]HSW07537.1 GGDEF domain-containing protein [Aquabacterium sp.]